MKGAAIVAGLLLGSAVAAFVACGGQQRPEWEARLRDHNEIQLRFSEIRQWRHEKGWDLEPPATLVQFVRGKRVRDAIKACPVAQPPACNDICSAADNICDNAEHICELADKLGKDDDFAQQKCASAKASCVDAAQRCCECSTKPPEPATGTP